MSKIVLDNIAGGFNLQTINLNFQKIVEEFNTKVLYRNNPVGEANTLTTGFDANNKDIINVGTLGINTDLVYKGGSLDGLLVGISAAQLELETIRGQVAIDAASAAVSSTSANAAATSASSSSAIAVSSASSATTSASNAATSASNAATSAGQASGYATTASTAATTATTQATNAATSASNASTSATAAAASLASSVAAEIVYTITNAGAVILAGKKGTIEVPFNATINSWTLIGDVSGSIVVDIKKSTYASYPTNTSITASAKPTLSSAQKAQSSTLTGWTTSLLAGDILEYEVTGTPASVSTVSLSLKITKV